MSDEPSPTLSLCLRRGSEPWDTQETHRNPETLNLKQNLGKAKSFPLQEHGRAPANKTEFSCRQRGAPVPRPSMVNPPQKSHPESCWDLHGSQGCHGMVTRAKLSQPSFSHRQGEPPNNQKIQLHTLDTLEREAFDSDPKTELENPTGSSGKNYLHLKYSASISKNCSSTPRLPGFVLLQYQASAHKSLKK